MSQFTKLQIRKMLDNSKRVAKRHQGIIERYASYPQHPRLFFHNNIHAYAMVQVLDTLIKMSGGGISKQWAEKALLAAAWHDANHSGHPDTWKDEDGKDNIQRAVEAYQAAGNNDLMVISLINETRYPVGDFLLEDPQYIRVAQLLRDTDQVWGFPDEYGAQAIIGLWLERFQSGEDTVQATPEEVVRRRATFLEGMALYTDEARNFLRAFQQDSINLTAKLYVEMERQNQLAEIIGSFGEDELNQMRAGKSVAEILQGATSVISHEDLMKDLEAAETALNNGKLLK